MSCAALVRWDWNGPVAPRPCRRDARSDSAFCGLHQVLAARPTVASSDGGWCIWCLAPGRKYECSRDPGRGIVFCDDCARAIARDVRTPRPAIAKGGA